MQFLETLAFLDHNLQQGVSSSLLTFDIGMVLFFLLFGTIHWHKYDVTRNACSSTLSEIFDCGWNDVGLMAEKARSTADIWVQLADILQYVNKFHTNIVGWLTLVHIHKLLIESMLSLCYWLATKYKWDALLFSLMASLKHEHGI